LTKIEDERDELAELFTSCGGQVWRAVLAASGGRREIADDVTAETFADYLQRRGTVRDPQAYLFKVAYRLVAKELQRERRQTELTEASYTPGQGSASVLSPELTQVLLALPVEQRFMLVLRYWLDLPVSEIARLTDSSTTAVKVRLHRIRRHLRTSMSESEVRDA
jgi:RNA polymerase sigma-70 factor, ECF subfamily